MTYQTLRVRFQDSVCFLQFNRPEANNTIDHRLVQDCEKVLAALCESSTTVLVLEGLPEVFCLGADFTEIKNNVASTNADTYGPESLYNLWLKLATGPYVTIAHVRGKANAGGIGFVAASDIVLADQTARFSLSELLFGLFPACVLPFLIRRVGFQKAHYLTLMTQPISAEQALAYGLVDACDVQSELLLRRHLLRLKPLSKVAIARYKRFMNEVSGGLDRNKSIATSANREMFSDPENLQKICRYVDEGILPWEGR